ncbi:hypothetical protein L1049_015625 [Liquidambar formosana]|uniref:DUF4218 domain-containing protein n=1 Tax=Liquidambar formosana TaxID=63359 RepID=A0AAP0X205_LIQFO
MKSHDCHVFLQLLLPIAIRACLRKDVSAALVDLSFFFKELYCRTLRLEVLERLQKEIVLVLCKLESIYPPAFFDVMVHLAVHLPSEAKLSGPVQYRWMYLIERFLHTLKCYVQNPARPEGSIAEGYINNECLTFCSMYLRGVETKFNREERNYDGGQGQHSGGLSVFSQNVNPLGARIYEMSNPTDLRKARCEHIEEIKRQSMINLNKRHQDEFPKWFEQHMKLLRSQNSIEATDQLYSLACGPDPRITRYTGCIVNGFRFHTEKYGEHHRTQNSGVVVKGEHQSEEEVDFYGVLTDVIMLSYCGGNRVFLFKCDWWDIGNKKMGIHQDDHFTSVNTARKWYGDDPFVLASQVKQVFYISDPKFDGAWKVVQKTQPRNLYDVPEVVEEEKDEDEFEESMGNDVTYQLHETNEINGRVEYDDSNVDLLHRDDVAPTYVDATIVEKNRRSHNSGNDHCISDDETDEDDTIFNYDTDEEGVMSNDIDSDTDEI